MLSKVLYFIRRIWLSHDEANLLRLREFTKARLIDIMFQPSDKVLEIGPSRSEGAVNSPVFLRYPGTYFDLKSRSVSSRFEYFDLDIDPGVNPTYLGDISKRESPLPSGVFDKIICFSVLEHIFDIQTAVDNIALALRREGELHIITPWDLRFHGPRPDCWRISDDAYRLLLTPVFREVVIHKIPNPARPLSPVGLYVIAKK